MTVPKTLLLPVKGSYTDRFGKIRNGRAHTGDDIAAPEGTPVWAAQDGIVKTALDGFSQEPLTKPYISPGGYGNQVHIDHAGYGTLYAHLHVVLVKPGQSVSRGDKIGTVGTTGMSTGNHTHWEVRDGGTTPVNPASYLGKNGGLSMGDAEKLRKDIAKLRDGVRRDRADLKEYRTAQKKQAKVLKDLIKYNKDVNDLQQAWLNQHNDAHTQPDKEAARISKKLDTAKAKLDRTMAAAEDALSGGTG